MTKFEITVKDKALASHISQLLSSLKDYNIEYTKTVIDEGDDQYWVKEIIKWSDRYNLNLPTDLAKLQEVEELNISCKSMHYIPKEIDNLIGLRYLELSNNYLISIPKSVANLENLIYLNLNINNITSLPKELLRFKSINYFGYNKDIIFV